MKYLNRPGTEANFPYRKWDLNKCFHVTPSMSCMIKIYLQPNLYSLLQYGTAYSLLPEGDKSFNTFYINF